MWWPICRNALQRSGNGAKAETAGRVAADNSADCGGDAVLVCMGLSAHVSASRAEFDSVPVRIGQHCGFTGQRTWVRFAIPSRYGADGVDDSPVSAAALVDYADLRDLHVRVVGSRGNHERVLLDTGVF